MDMEKSADKFKIFNAAKKFCCIFLDKHNKKKDFSSYFINSLRKEEENL